MRSIKRAFTLIELLVVITIIVVLLSLLVPAMDKAIYQAELVACAARLDGHAGSVITYAMDFKRYYPKRSALTGSHPWLNTLRGRDGAGQWIDDRELLFQYIQPKFFLDPLCSDTIDLEDVETLTTFVAATYIPYYGFNYTAPQSQGATRLGKNIKWNGVEFDVLVGDQDWAADLITVSSHADFSPSRMVLYEYQNQPLLGGPEGVALSAAGGYNVVMARWGEPSNSRVRGLLDTQHAAQDGSVTRLSAVPRDAERSDYKTATGKIGVTFNSPHTQADLPNGHWFQVPR